MPMSDAWLRPSKSFFGRYGGRVSHGTRTSSRDSSRRCQPCLLFLVGAFCVHVTGCREITDGSVMGGAVDVHHDMVVVHGVAVHYSRRRRLRPPLGNVRREGLRRLPRPPPRTAGTRAILVSDDVRGSHPPAHWDARWTTPPSARQRLHTSCRIHASFGRTQ